VSLWLSEGQSWVQLAELGLAFVLSSLIGLERELRQRSAGLRTHTLVGVGAAALFMLVSKYGFFDVLQTPETPTSRQSEVSDERHYCLGENPPSAS
jgi:uncharacterized membrane protein YhiD involved in acid resistance